MRRTRTQRLKRTGGRRTGGRRGWWLLLALLGGAMLGSRALAVTADPWPNSPVLTRLFRLPGARGDVQRLRQDLHLSQEQLAALQELSTQEQHLAQAGDKVADRLEARQLNTQIAAMRQSKDVRARDILGAQYPAFREWLRAWWQTRVLGSKAQAQRLSKPLPQDDGAAMSVPAESGSTDLGGQAQ